MTQSSTEQIRNWSGLAVLSYGFRPFFLLGTLWAVFAMIMWITMLAGGPILPTQFDPVSWHAHEFLFGYLSAIIAGFLLTAVPNWTGRFPVVGGKLAWMVVLWLIGRTAVAISNYIPSIWVSFIDLLFPLTLSVLMLREILKAKENWGNILILGIFWIYIFANGLFHFSSAQGEFAAQGLGLRLGLSAALMLVLVIGGRIIPSFTRNWLVKTGSDVRPVPPMQPFDKFTLTLTIVGLSFWTLWPKHSATGIFLLVIAVLQLMRLLRWKGLKTGREPLVWALHCGYGFVPLGALCMGANILFSQNSGTAAAQHIWMAGVIGLMTLALMTRVTLGHTAQIMHANAATTGIYLAMIASVIIRSLVELIPGISVALYSLSAMFWIAAFGGFIVIYGPILVRPKASRT